MRASCLSLLCVVGACVAEVEEAATPAPPPGAYAEFVVSQLVPPFFAGATWIGRTPGATVWFVVSRNGIGPGPCMQGNCLDVLPPLLLLDRVTVDRYGRAITAAVLPAGLPQGTYSFQAVEAGPSGVVLSDVWERELGFVACPTIWAPVCAADGDTYGNECEANAAGWPAVRTGPCP